MEYLFEGIKQGLLLLFPPQKEIIGIVFLSIVVSGTATVLSGALAIPVGIFLAVKEFRFKRFLTAILNTSLAFPAVLIGLLVYIFLSRRGPLGAFELLFTPYAIIIAQAILATPIIATLVLSALKGIAKDVQDVSYSLGANKYQMALILIKEGKFAFLTSVITGFSRVIGETGMTLMVGGNIKGETRVMTTTIALETMKGNFEIGIAVGLVLLFVAIVINIILQIIQGK
ncbi:MAG: ABC transporter permease [bacterium]|nr:ABC transporter permease [bacterium]